MITGTKAQGGTVPMKRLKVFKACGLVYTINLHKKMKHDAQNTKHD
jgi:hypothetical protein